MRDKKIPPSGAEFAVEALRPENQRIQPVNEHPLCHPLQTCLRENGERVGMDAAIAQQAELIERQAADIARWAHGAEINVAALRDAHTYISELRDEIAALRQSCVVLPDHMAVPRPIWKDARQPYGNPLNDAEIKGAELFNLAIDEVARLNASRDEAPEDEQAVFEAWLARVCPSGDCERVQAQFEASGDYRDFHAAPTHAPDHSADDLKMVSVPRELLEHVKHARKELLRMDRAPLSIRQKLAQKLTDLLAGGAQ